MSRVKSYTKILMTGMLISIILLLSGCSSLQSIIRSNLEDTPTWVFEPRVARDRIAFVGEGTGESERTARVRSYESILSQISDYLGKDISNAYIAEISSSRVIDDFNLTITREFVKESEGNVTVYFLAVAERAVMEENRSELLVEIEQTRQAIKTLSAGASTFLRSYRDAEAVKNYFEIIRLSSTMNRLEGIPVYQEAVEDIISVIEKLTIVPVKDIPHTYSVQRGSKNIAPRIEGVPLVISIQTRDVLNRQYTDEIKIVSNSEGTARFVNTDSAMLRRGKYQISFDTDLFLSRSSLLLESDIQRIERAIVERSISVPYTREFSAGSSRMMLALGEYSLRGDLLKTTYASQIVETYLEDYDLEFLSIHHLLNGEEDDFFDEVARMYPQSNLPIIYGKVGVVSFTPLSSAVTVKVAGETTLYDSSGQRVIGTTGMVSAIGKGSDEASALADAFAMYGRSVSSLLKRFLFTE